MRRLGWLFGLCVALGAMGVPAREASANDVWLWACAGPDGQALGGLGEGASATGGATAACVTGDQSPGLRVSPTAGTSTWTFDMPFSAPLDAVRIGRTLAISEGQTYQLQADGLLESM